MTWLVAAVLLGAAAIGGFVLLVNDSDQEATTEAGTPGAVAPGRPARPPAALAATLRRGNVVVEVPRGDRTQRTAVEQLVTEVTGAPPSGQAPLLRVGQGVEVREVAGADDVEAYADGRRLQAISALDPDLRRFVEYWLGRAAG